MKKMGYICWCGHGSDATACRPEGGLYPRPLRAASGAMDGWMDGCRWIFLE